MRSLAFCCVALAAPATPLAAQLPLDSLLSQPVSAAARYLQTMSEAPAAVTIVTAEDIRRFGYRTLEDVLRRVPGLYFSYDRNYTYLGVRGFSRPSDYTNRVLLLLNGTALNEGVFGSAPVGTDFALDPDVIERVEVVMGPGSALYGTGAMLTSVNVVTRDGRAVDGLLVAVEAGSYGLRRVSAVTGQTLSQDVEVAVAAVWTDVDGDDHYYAEYDSSASGGVARGLDFDRWRSLLTRVTYRGLSVTAHAATRTKGIPTGAFGVTFNDPQSRTTDARTHVAARYEALLSPRLRLALDLHAMRYDYDGTYPYDGQPFFDASRDDYVGGESQLQWDLGPHHRLLAGAELQRHARASYAYWSTDTTFYDRNAPYWVRSAYVQDEWQATENVAVVVGVRHDARTGTEVATTPRAALVVHAGPRTTLKVLYGAAFRAPNVYERFYEDPFTGFKRSAGLVPERIRTGEIVWEQRLGREFFAAASVFSFRMNDLIDTQLDAADSLLQFRNLQRARAVGATASLDARLVSGLTAYASYGYQDAEDVATDARLSNAPVHTVRGGLSTVLTPYATIAAEARYESGRVTVYRDRTDGYLWAGAHLLLRVWSGPQRPGRARPTAELSLAVSNLFDVAYATPGGFEHLQHAIQQDGRTFTARLRVRW